jgi:hypothetical protein
MKFTLLLAVALGLAVSAGAQESNTASTTPHSRLVGGHGELGKFSALQPLPPGPKGKARAVMGDINGFLRVYEQRDGGYEEIWVSQYFEGGIGAVFIVDVDDDELDEIVFYTDRGRFHFLDASDYQLIWSIPPNQYERITAFTVHDIDEDPQPELIFCGDGRLIIFDGRDQFESWRSEQADFSSTQILIGDVDGDDTDEIVLNEGVVFDSQFFDLEWQSPEPFGERMGLLDIDADGIPELIGEFRQHFLRVFDVDQRRQKSISR